MSQPGTKGDIVWQFTKAGEYQFACLMPAHFEAGMVGKVKVKPASTSPAVKAPAAASATQAGHGAHSH